jgi:hypothetical protein
MLCTKSILSLHSTQLTRLKPEKSTNCHKQELPWAHYCKEAVDVVKHRLEDFTICAGHLLVLRMEARMDDPIHVKVEIVIFLSIGVWLKYSVWQLDVLFDHIHHNAWIFVR